MSRLAPALRSADRSSGRVSATGELRDTRVDVKVVLSGLWVAMIVVFAYVDLFGFFREDVLRSALDGKVGTTDLRVTQLFLASSLVYVLVPTLMVVLSLVLRARPNRVVNLVVSGLYALSVVVSCIGEDWAYYLMGSAAEVLLLVAVARVAWTWPPAEPAPGPSLVAR